MKTILVSAYPKSGSTWLTSLLGDVLNCPTGGSCQSGDKTEIATKDRPNKDFIVRKGHYKLIMDFTDKAIPMPHFLNWQFLDDNYKVIFLVRDPRDVCVSGAYHWRCSVPEFLRRMIVGSVVHLDRWDEHIFQWLDLIKDPICNDLFCLVRYEDLHKDTAGTVNGILRFLQATEYKGRIDDAIHQNSFEVKARQVTDKRRHNMRKGIVGDWRNQFDTEMNNLIYSEFGWIMEKLNYEK